MVLCALSIAILLCHIDPLVAWWFYFILYYLVMFFVHDYTLSVVGSLCCSVIYYNSIFVWPYYIVIQNSKEKWHCTMQCCVPYTFCECNENDIVWKKGNITFIIYLLCVFLKTKSAKYIPKTNECPLCVHL